MNHRKFKELVRRLEVYAARDPGGYRRRSVLLALVGYVYPVAVMIVLLALAVACFWGTYAAFGNSFDGRLPIIPFIFGILLLVGAGGIWKALTARTPIPQGIMLREADAPTLFMQIEEVRRKAGGPKLKGVILSGDFNAGAMERPRLGLLGWRDSYLLLGLPYMEAMTDAQLRAVLAHEFRHLGPGQSRVSAWIYRTVRSWEQLGAEKTLQEGMGKTLFGWFGDRYFPRFFAYTFVLRRANEYDADACAARVSGAPAAAAWRVKSEIWRRLLERQFWPHLNAMVAQQEAPPKGIHAMLAEFLRHPIEAAHAEALMGAALRVKTGIADTHPSLDERLAALGESDRSDGALARLARAAVEDAGEHSAADVFLGAKKGHFQDLLSRTHRASIMAGWRQAHEQAKQELKRADDLEAKAKKADLTPEEDWILAYFRQKHDPERAVAILEAFLARYPEHADARFKLGEKLLEEEDERGIDHLERSMNLKPDYQIAACQRIVNFLREQGRDDECDEFEKRMESHSGTLEESRKERSDATGKDEFFAHGLAAAQVAEIAKRLAAYPQIKLAYLVQKKVKLFPEKPCYVLELKIKVTASQEPAQVMRFLADRLQAEIKPPMLVGFLGAGFLKVSKKVRAVHGALIYEAARKPRGNA